MNKRAQCNSCAFPVSMCVCAAVNTLTFSGRCVIIQEAHERQHAKNTVRLLQLVLPQLEVILSSDLAALDDLRVQVSAEVEAWGLLYPSANSEVLDDPATALPELPKQWILLDGTWRKTKRLWFEHAWLSTVRTFCFIDPPASQYFIRKVPSLQTLSTLESVAYLLQLTQGRSMDALVNLQSHFVAQWQRHQPALHKTRKK